MSTMLASPAAHSDRLFYSGIGLAAAATVFLGFSPTFYQRSADLPALPLLFIVHGTLFTSWFLLFFAQTTLIAADRRDLHRRLGVIAALVAGAMVVIGISAAVDALRRGSAPIPGLDPRSFFAVPMGDMLTFPILVSAGIYFRRNADTHKRLMTLATVGILSAAIARIPLPLIKAGGPVAFFGLEDILVLAGPVYDFATRGRVHRAYIWGGALLILSQPLRLMISGTAVWLSFADWFLR
jgi:hypothetical protein